MRFFKKKEKWRIEKGSYEETARELSNPTRGWYQIYSFRADKDPDIENLVWSLREPETLALLFFDIGAYREKPLDAGALQQLQSLLAFFGENHRDIILRIAYDHEGKGMEHEPSRLAMVVRHMEQLGPVVMKYQNCIYILQGLFIGSWGEMHSSKFTGEVSLKKLYDTWSKATGNHLYLAVRTPGLYRKFRQQCELSELERKPYLTVFDDGILGSETHLGSFGMESKRTTGWSGIWNPEEEMEFLRMLGRRCPIGGEVLWGAGGTDHDFAECSGHLAEMKVSYLNCIHDSRRLEYWKTEECMEKGVFFGRTGYDYVGAHLGYRFCIRDCYLPKGNLCGETVELHIQIENTGYANFYQESEIRLESESGIRIVPDTDLRDIESGTVRDIGCQIPLKQDVWYLTAERKTDHRKIHFACEEEEQGKIKLGTLIQS